MLKSSIATARKGGKVKILMLVLQDKNIVIIRIGQDFQLFMLSSATTSTENWQLSK